MKRRIIAALAALGLTATMAVGLAPAAQADEVPGTAYVALGDSEAAGTGNLPYVDETCKRSAKAYPAVLASSMGWPYVSAACAGATTDGVLMQVGMLAAAGKIGPATQVVTLTAGINNLGWQEVFSVCSTGTEAACAQALAVALANAQTLPQKLAGVLLAIRTAAPAAHIVVTDYPLLFGDVTGSCSVGALQGTPVKVSAAQAAMVNQAIGQLDTLIMNTVQGYALQTGDPMLHFVDVAVPFMGHGLCDTGDRWISGLVSGKKTSDRSLHINAPGQQALAWVLAGALAP